MNEFTEDGFLAKKLTIRQPKDGFRAAIDPVMLAASAPLADNMRVLELGCGVGVALIIALWRNPTLTGLGIDISPSVIELASANARLNHMEGRVEFLCHDLNQPHPGYNSFDLLLMNPPFAVDGSRSAHPERLVARHEEATPLSQWLEIGLKFLKPEGQMVLIHRAGRIGEILSLLSPKAGSFEIIPLYPKNDKPAKLMLIRARKGGKTPTVLWPGLVLHENQGNFTACAQEILHNATFINQVMGWKSN